MTDLNTQRIIRVLAEYSERGLSRGEIAKLLRSGQSPARFSDAALKRLLKKLVDEDLIRAEGRTKGTRYYWTSTAYGTMDESFAGIFSPESLRLLSQLQRPTHLRHPVCYNRELLTNYAPNETAYLSHHGRRLLEQAGRKVRGQVQLPAGTYARKILERLLIDLSFNSSRLEGNTYTLLDTERLIGAGEAAPEKSFEERTMILNHKEAIQYLVEQAAGIPPSPFLIRNLHYALTQDLLPNPGAPGAIRNIPVNIGQSVYAPSAVPQVLRECLELICKKAAQIDDPYEESFFLLVHLSYLQAFEDGNKRTARLASNLPLVKDNLCPNAYADIPRDAYTHAILALYELNELGPLAEAYQFTYRRSALRYDVVIQTTARPDEFRLEHRALRKAALGEIIKQNLRRGEVDAFVSRWLSTQDVPTEDRPLLLLHIKQDLEAINAGRLVGIDVTDSQFKRWQQRYRN